MQSTEFLVCIHLKSASTSPKDYQLLSECQTVWIWVGRRHEWRAKGSRCIDVHIAVSYIDRTVIICQKDYKKNLELDPFDFFNTG